MPLPCLPLHNHTPSILRKELCGPTSTFGFQPTKLRKLSRNSINFSCKAATSSSSSITDLDLYDLLGIDGTCDQSQIKNAYRSLQKRCHPDIAGPAGHDMAIILNQAYAILSDPNSRLAYDKEQAKLAELKGFIGRPLYSAWLGSESEQRAVFVDEVKCVGCLKCALFAEKTFAIESIYGRARVVAQWADPENKIQEAIDACPVNCISIVERSDLAALEFLMSKQPRGSVRVGTGNTVGVRVSNIFMDMRKFQARFKEAKEKASIHGFEETDLQREARLSAIQAIRSISNWLYWQSPKASQTKPDAHQIPACTGHESCEPSTKKLQDAAAARKEARESSSANPQVALNYRYSEEYWTPSSFALPPSTKSNTRSTISNVPSQVNAKTKTSNEYNGERENQSSPIRWGFPMVSALIAIAIVQLHGEGAVSGLDEHIGGSLAIDIVNSTWLQMILAGATWYMIVMAIVELVAIIGSKEN